MTHLISKTDVPKIFRLLTGLYPQSAKVFEQADELTRDAWFSLLNDLPRDMVLLAIKSHAAVNKYAPTVADIRAEVVRLVCPELNIGSDEAWEMVSEVIRKNKGREEIQRLPAEVRATAGAVGWYEIRTSENPEATRAQFMRMYDQRVAREIKRRQIPASVHNDIERLGGVNGKDCTVLSMQG